MSRISTGWIMYIFGNQYYLLDKRATTCAGWRDFQRRSIPARDHTARDTPKVTVTQKWEERELKAMKYNQSLLKRNPSCYLECTVLYKRYRSLALNIGLFGGKRKRKKKMKESWQKCPLEQTVYSQSSKFRFCNEKKRCCRGKESVYWLFFVKA